MTLAELKSYTRKELAALAKQYRIAGWHPMKKDELIRALKAVTRTQSVRSRKDRRNGRTATASAKRHQTVATKNGKGRGNGRNTGSNGRGVKAATNGKLKTAKRSKRPDPPKPQIRDLAKLASQNGVQDLLAVRVCDPYWLHVEWELSQAMIARARAALNVEWHVAEPVIRLFDVTADDSTSSSKTLIAAVKIQGDTNHWYVQVKDPTHSYKLDIGYLAPSGKFFSMANSNTVRTSRPKSLAAGLTSESNSKRSRPLSSTSLPKSRYGARRRDAIADFELSLNTELIISGATHPEAELTLLGTPISLERDGTFSISMHLKNGRQLIPAVAVTPNGREQRTIVLAVERNTKELEPLVLDDT